MCFNRNTISLYYVWSPCSFSSASDSFLELVLFERGYHTLAMLSTAATTPCKRKVFPWKSFFSPLVRPNIIKWNELKMFKCFFPTLLYTGCPIYNYNPVGKIAKTTVWRSEFLLIRLSKYSAMLSKIHSFRLLFRRFCPPVNWILFHDANRHRNASYNTAFLN